MESLSDYQYHPTASQGIHTTHTDVSPQCVYGFVFVCFFLFFKPGGGTALGTAHREAMGANFIENPSLSRKF